MKPKIFGIGEILWDMLPTGPRMGGAPANFACHASALGGDAGLFSRIGVDAFGGRLIRNLEDLGVSTDGVTTDTVHRTGTVDVELGDDGQPHFAIHQDVAWDHLKADATMVGMAAGADAVCFGTLGQRSAISREAIGQLVAATSKDALRILDVNLRQEYYSADLIHKSLQLANVLKLSDGELPVIAGLLALEGTVHDQLDALLDRYELRMVVYTRGSHGSILRDETEWNEHPGQPAEVRDTIGAGDSFTAAVALGMLHGWPIAKIADVANQVASHVCSCSGAVPLLPGVILDLFGQTARFPTGKPEFRLRFDDLQASKPEVFPPGTPA